MTNVRQSLHVARVEWPGSVLVPWHSVLIVSLFTPQFCHFPLHGRLDWNLTASVVCKPPGLVLSEELIWLYGQALAELCTPIASRSETG